MELFGNAWEPVAGLGEQFTEGHCTGKVRSLCMSLWTVVMTDLQQALRTCGFTPAQEKVLLHSMWAGKSVHTQLSLPDEQVVTVHDVPVTMASAVEDYKVGHYKRFGEALGNLCREMVVVSFPQQWEFDDDGQLTEKLQTLQKPTPGLAVFLAVPSLLLVAGVAIRRARFAAETGLLDESDPLNADVELCLE